jgi:hypothetical protein
MELAASRLQCDASTQASTAKWKSSRGVPRSGGLALYRRLYEEGFSEKQVVYTHLHVDLLLILPQPLMIRFRQEILAMEKDKNMPYVDSILSIVPKPVESCRFENHGFAVFLGAFSPGLSASDSSFFEWMPRAFNAEQV